jgi:hypothetical protein
MYLPQLIAALLFVTCFAITGYMEPRYETWKGARRTNALSMLVGDSRRLFANHFFAKADAYFHAGYYPTIFDQQKSEARSHMEESTAEEHEDESEKHEEHEEPDFLGKPLDWIEAFGRNFFPSEHVHLEKPGDAREILPWLRLTAELDPTKVETYTIAAYALRNSLHKPDEAEAFLRDGLRANPDSYQILYELARLRSEQDQHGDSARHLLELALQKWQRHSATAAEPDIFVGAQILGYLAKLELEQGEPQKAVLHLEELKKISPFKEHVEMQIRELKARIPQK